MEYMYPCYVVVLCRSIMENYANYPIIIYKIKTTSTLNNTL